MSIKDFINEYSSSDTVRLHMPGHKGSFGYSADITEINGADSLYMADGIILDSENRTSELFGTRHTFYSTEGSSQVIKAMCFLAMQQFYSHESGNASLLSASDTDRTIHRPAILATRNAHKAFIHASMLLGIDIKWIKGNGEDYSLCKCEVTPEYLDKYLSDSLKELNSSDSCNYQSSEGTESPVQNLAAIYVTSPDYLGNILDIKGLAEVAHKYGLMLLVDNAHGSYLKFVESSSFEDSSVILSQEDLSQSQNLIAHPITLGADMCADSAHKTLPVLTGGAYLHISKSAPEGIEKEARNALLLFGSTSPSYLIMESLDSAVSRISKSVYIKCSKHVLEIKKQLSELGVKLIGEEPLKLTFDLRNISATGNELSRYLRENGFECEYSDRDFVVTMWSPYMDYQSAGAKLMSVMKKAISENDSSPKIKLTKLPEVRFQPYETIFMPHRIQPVSFDLTGKVAAEQLISCPPAISPIIAGEVINEEIINILNYYDIDHINILM